jgi:hypothetical protein
MAKKRRTNNDLQNITQKAKHWATRTLQKSGDELWYSIMVSNSCTASENHSDIVVMNEESVEFRSRQREHIYKWPFVAQIFRNG